jgi:phospholipase C
MDPARDQNCGPDGKPIAVSTPAEWALAHDPGHEYPDVLEQLCGSGGAYPQINNSGFVSNYAKIDAVHPDDIMKCYAPEQLPVINTLAREFAVCDHWFSSLPGPTWPNRFFIHAASSAGLDHSPTTANIASSILINGYKFENGTIYDRLDDEGISWAIYKGDPFPQALAINGMTVRLVEGHFHEFEDFSKHVQDPNYSTSYTFIEPDYHVAADFAGGNSQHPKDDVTRGEALLKAVYEAIRNSPHWENSVLIVTYDEHGGFYDHVPPPRTVAPGDPITDPENNLHNFDFTQLGVRVPAIIISPLIPRNIIDHSVYDHTSALATIEHIFGLLPLTDRDRQANALNHLFSLDAPRTDAPLKLPDPVQSGITYTEEPEESIAAKQVAANPVKAAEPPDPAVHGFLHIAFLRERQASSQPEHEQHTARYLSASSSRAEAKRYLVEVRHKVESSQSG